MAACSRDSEPLARPQSAEPAGSATTRRAAI
jgi:hypothetical protein